jgi:spore maturation protein CgeB
MACGGLVLFDYKADFRESMGEIADQVMYKSVDHLNRLVEEYLSDPRKRRDVSRYLQHRVCTEFSFGALCQRILVDEPAWRN